VTLVIILGGILGGIFIMIRRRGRFWAFFVTMFIYRDYTLAHIVLLHRTLHGGDEATLIACASSVGTSWR
jgi:TRAP-type C4-dicarboxylate transport system permease large subunit